MISLLIEISKSFPALVGLSAFMATFIASVMADEQNDRIRQGAFGAIAGASVGGFAAVIQKEPILLLVGVFGSSVGAIVGWIAYLLLSLIAGTKLGRRLIEYQVGGLKLLREQMRLDERALLLAALNTWSQNFRSMVLRSAPAIGNGPSEDINLWAKVVIHGWLISLIDTFNLILDAVAEKKEYRSRIALIVFGKDAKGSVIGKYWFTYSSNQQQHKTDRNFGPDSIAYQVLAGDITSPRFVTIEKAKEVEDRGASDYSSFYIFRLTRDAVISLDWPGKFTTDDPYVQVAASLLHIDVGRSIAELLDRWNGSIAGELGLDRLNATPPVGGGVGSRPAAIVAQAPEGGATSGAGRTQSSVP